MEAKNNRTVAWGVNSGNMRLKAYFSGVHACAPFYVLEPAESSDGFRVLHLKLGITQVTFNHNEK